jgi:hypothetical protein
VDLKQKLFDLTQLGGTLVTDEHFEHRRKKCLSCPLFTQSLPILDVPGCTVCKCPLETKGKLWKYFSPSKLKIIRAECPKGFWKDIDNKCKKNYE